MTAPSEPPLCVDLDGTLIRGDTTWLSVFSLTLHRPWLWYGAALALPHGRAAFKAFLSKHVVLAPDALPWRSTVLEFLRTERRRGRRLILTTAAHERVAQVVAQYLGLFEHVLASTDTHNLKAAAKLEQIRKLLDGKEFDYIGDTFADLPILAAARHGYLVGPSRRMLARARRVARIEAVF